MKTEAFNLCVPTLKIEQDLFKTTFAVPVLPQFTPLAPVHMATIMKSAELFSGSVRFHMFSDGAKASISAISDEKVLFSVPLLLSDASIHFDFSVTADSLSDIQTIASLGQDFLSSGSGVCVFFKS